MCLSVGSISNMDHMGTVEGVRVAAGTEVFGRSGAVRRHAGSSVRLRPLLAAGAALIGATAIGALAVGALTVGAIAVGRMAVGRLLLGKGIVDTLEIGTLRVGVLDMVGGEASPDDAGHRPG